MLQHKHLIMGLDIKWPPKDSEEAVAFLQFLIKRVDMSIAKDESLGQNPHGYYCNHPGNEGVTATGILETSHCAIHSWNLSHPGKLQFDLYSCKDFDIPYVIDLCNSFGIVSGSYMVIDRNTKLKLLEEGELGENGVIKPNQISVGNSVSELSATVTTPNAIYPKMTPVPSKGIVPKQYGGEV